ncbi:MAG: hypothetical protein H6673_13840 [Anaerolineales bacterium]|nr:hypothetical protein [Anaerolineales bacterium]
MDNIFSTLYAIQSLELAVDEARQRLHDIEAALSNDAVITATRQTLSTTEAALHEASAHTKNLELELSSLIQKIQEVDTLVYSGKIKNPKELQERNDEVASLRRRQTTLEEQLAEAKKVQSTAQQHHTEAQHTLEEALAHRVTDETELIEERDQLNHEIDTILRKRKAKMQGIPKETFDHYRNLRKRKRGQAIALLKEDSCSACGIEQPSSDVQRILHGDEMVYCIGCGRILVTG